MTAPQPVSIERLSELEGPYTATPEGPDAGEPATFSLVRRGAFLHATGDRVGLALPWAGRLVVVFGPLNKTEIGAYRVTAKEVVGLWVPPGADQPDYGACGVEFSVPDAAAKAGELADWRISKAKAIDGTTYAGKISRDPIHGTDPAAIPRPVHMLWRLEDGDFRSFALDFGDALYATFCFDPEQPHGVAVYDLKAMRGTALTSTGRGATTESLTRG